MGGGGGANISFAKKCGLSDTVIGKYLRGESYPGIDKLPAISQACGKSIEWLLTGENAHTENRGIKKNSEIIEWWQIIFKSLNEDEIEKVIETFKNGGKSALFSLQSAPQKTTKRSLAPVIDFPKATKQKP